MLALLGGATIVVVSRLRVNLYVHKLYIATKVISGRLHEKHVVATWKLGNHLSICFKDTGKPRKKTCIEVAGRRTFRTLTSSQQSGIYSKHINTHITTIHSTQVTSAQKPITSSTSRPNTTIQQIQYHNYPLYHKYTKQQISLKITTLHCTLRCVPTHFPSRHHVH